MLSASVLLDSPPSPGYHSPTKKHSPEYNERMPAPEESPPDPLTIGELISLQDAAEYAGLTRDSLTGYIRRGRLKAKKIGPVWVTTRAAIDAYLASRDTESIPKKYRSRS